MAVDLIKQFEAVPSVYPPTYVAPSPEKMGLSPEAMALDRSAIWARIEAYTAHRFTPREVVWTLTGDGGDQWHPPLTPIISREGHVWRHEAWTPINLLDGPLGLCLPSDGIYRITAQVGAVGVPPPVYEAFRRLAEYLADTDDRAGASEYAVSMGGEIEESYKRNLAWVARAMQQSGAADLLRPYRRA